MGNTGDCDLVLHGRLTLALLVRLPLHVDDLLERTLLESSIGPSIGCLTLLVHVHPLVLRVGHRGHLKTHIVVFIVVDHLDLDYLSIDDVGGLLANRRDLPCALISYLHTHFNVDESARVDVLGLE